MGPIQLSHVIALTVGTCILLAICRKMEWRKQAQEAADAVDERTRPDPLSPRTRTSELAWPLWAIRDELDYLEMKERYDDRKDNR